MVGCPSGQWDRTVNPPALPSKVQILHPPEQRKEAQELVCAFYRGFGAFPAPFKFDATHDLSRVLCFPGSLNFKDVDNPKVIEFLTENPSPKSYEYLAGQLDEM